MVFVSLYLMSNKSLWICIWRQISLWVFLTSNTVFVSLFLTSNTVLLSLFTDIKYSLFESVSDVKYSLFESVSDVKYSLFESVSDVKYCLCCTNPLPLWTFLSLACTQRLCDTCGTNSAQRYPTQQLKALAICGTREDVMTPAILGTAGVLRLKCLTQAFSWFWSQQHIVRACGALNGSFAVADGTGDRYNSPT